MNFRFCDAGVFCALGKIVESGTHHELMQKRGYYYELYMRQYSEMAADMASG